jgi:hypothetical protein
MTRTSTTNKKKYCWCGQSLHYANHDQEQQVEEISAKYGHYMRIKTSADSTYSVPRHFIALHGLNGKDLNLLGFKLVK